MAGIRRYLMEILVDEEEALQDKVEQSLKHTQRTLDNLVSNVVYDSDPVFQDSQTCVHAPSFCISCD